MATDQTFEAVFMLLGAAYDKRIDETRRTLYKGLLKSIDDALLLNGVKHAITKCKFFPTVAEILEAIKEVSLWAYAVPSSAEAWQVMVNLPAPRVVRSQCDEAIRLREEAMGAVADQYQAILKAIIIHDRTCTECKDVRVYPTFPHPLIEQVARRMGWPDKFWTDELGVDRGRFIKVYESEVAMMTGKAATLPEVRQYIEQKQLSLLDADEINSQFKREAFDRGSDEIAMLATMKRIGG